MVGFQVDIGNFLTEKFTEIFQAEPIVLFECLNEFILESISDKENARINAIPTAEDICNIVKNMHSIKAPGPDGMLALFFQNFWSTVGQDVIEKVQNVF